MAISDEELGTAIRTILQMPLGFYVGFAGMLEIGQLENLNYWVESKGIDETQNYEDIQLWYKDDLTLDEAIGHFLRIRRERELGFDIEVDLNPTLGHIGPRK